MKVAIKKMDTKASQKFLAELKVTINLFQPECPSHGSA
jgi:hypothetical protein